MSDRFQSIDEFFPFYLKEHSHPVSRRLHFVGTTGALVAGVASTALNPIGFPLAVAGMVAIGKRAVEAERKKPSLGRVAAMLALPTVASPVLFPAGVVFAYGCAWTGHFVFEKNKPATFGYPVMSLTSDFKMYGKMLRGKLWSGDPLEELGLGDASATPAPVEAPAPQPAHAVP